MKTFPLPRSARRPDAHAKTERREGSNKVKDSLFYDSGDRRRLWGMVSSLTMLCIAEALAILGLLALVAFLVTVAVTKNVYGIEVHADGSRTSVIGELKPLRGDATLKTLQWNAEHYVDDLFSRGAFDGLQSQKTSVLHRTASGSPAEASVNKIFNEHFSSASRGHLKVSDIDCHSEGRWAGSTAAARFDCAYIVTAVDGAGAADPTVRPQHYESHLEIQQGKPVTDSAIIYDNPDNVFTSYIDQVPQP